MMSFIELQDKEGEQSKPWTTSPEYQRCNLVVTATKFLEVSNLLIERPNLNSSHLFRADILYDSSGTFQTTTEKEYSHGILQSITTETSRDDILVSDVTVPRFENFTLTRQVLRRLIPRNPERDQPLDQACFIYTTTAPVKQAEHDPESYLVVYTPLLQPDMGIPWYHPQVQALAFLFEENDVSTSSRESAISVHYKPLACESINDESSTRLHRTMLSLLHTMVRLTKMDPPSAQQPPEQMDESPVSARPTAPAALKDTILPQHLVQDTYTRLKQTYASDLINRWVEKTEPSKHVFEDLSIAAFLIELWRQMYGNDKGNFPGFVDLACGNGVLVYVLIKEGYRGYGYDARHRKTWQILNLEDNLEERLCVPKPFWDSVCEVDSVLVDIALHNGLFPPNTFIISNHADELTTWTPLLAFLSDPDTPLPFLAIPCCSHALSGARHRYNLKDIDIGSNSMQINQNDQEERGSGSQPKNGDLRALRKEKQKAVTHTSDTSQYACLTKKVVALAEELGFETEMTLMRIPSTRNIGIVGNRKLSTTTKRAQVPKIVRSESLTQDKEVEKVRVILERECSRDGGIEAAAKTWMERARKLQQGSGRGKVNLGAKPISNSKMATEQAAAKDAPYAH